MSLPSHPYVASRPDLKRLHEYEFLDGGGSRPLGILTFENTAGSGPLTALDIEKAVQAIAGKRLAILGPGVRFDKTYGPGWPD